jgi:class 3 adenylate cyclase
VLDAAGSSSAVLFADDGGGGAVLHAAVRAPERVRALVFVNGAASYVRREGYPIGLDPELFAAFVAVNTDPDDHWTLGEADDLTLNVPSLRDDEGFRSWWVRASQRSASPATARALLSTTVQSDTRELLPQVTVPTLVVHGRRNRFVPVELGRYLGEHIPGASYVELPTADSAMWGGDADMYVDEIEEFLTGQRGGGVDRVLTTVLFTDIVDSTGRAVALGDRQWRALLDRHDAVVRRELARFGGRAVNTTGDGFLAAFESPTQAVRAGAALVEAAARERVPIRVGVHTGEAERRGDDLAGLTVHIASRVAGLAASGEVLISRTVRDLVAGSGVRFVARGEHELKGVPDQWQLFALEG